MAYEKTTWANGDLITPQKLNKLEQGVVDASASGGNIIIANGEMHPSGNLITLDIKPSDIYDEATEKLTKIPIAVMPEADYMALYFIGFDYSDDYIDLIMYSFDGSMVVDLIANSIDDYFVYEIPDDGGA